MLAEGCSLEEIGRRVDRHPSTVSYWMRKHSLDAVFKERHAPRGGLNEDTLRELVDAGSSVREIAETLDVSAATVRHWLKRFGLRTVRARQPWAAMSGERFIAVCRVHGETTFEARADSGRRCLKCRSEAVMRRRRLVKDTLVAEAGGACALCGYDRYSGALEFHHIDPSDKGFSISQTGVTRSLERARSEASKCVLLCATCHAEVEGGITVLDANIGQPGPCPG